jgi:LPXTG-motif cell wall-anchored protein
MSKKLKVMLIAAIVAVFGVGFGGAALAQTLPAMGTANGATGGLIAPALGNLGDTSHGPCVQQLLNMPALNSCRDANGKVIMNLPALSLIGPAAAPKKLPATGANTGDIAAMGAAALAAGFVLLRRVRLAIAS